MTALPPDSSSWQQPSLRERIARAQAGRCVLTGGQTGVDTLAAQSALRAGLAVHLVFPLGFSQEDGPLTPARRAELARRDPARTRQPGLQAAHLDLRLPQRRRHPARPGRRRRLPGNHPRGQPPWPTATRPDAQSPSLLRWKNCAG